MTAMQKAGKAKFEKRKAAWEGRTKARAERLTARVGKGAWAKLEALFRGAMEHGEATKQRLLDFVAFRYGNHAEQAQFVLWAISKHALRAEDPIAELNRQLNEAEKEPTVDKSWTQVPANEGGK